MSPRNSVLLACAESIRWYIPNHASSISFTEITTVSKEETTSFRDCADILQSGETESGLYSILLPNSSQTVKVIRSQKPLAFSAKYQDWLWHGIIHCETCVCILFSCSISSNGTTVNVIDFTVYFWSTVDFVMHTQKHTLPNDIRMVCCFYGPNYKLFWCNSVILHCLT